MNCGLGLGQNFPLRVSISSLLYSSLFSIIAPSPNSPLDKFLQRKYLFFSQNANSQAKLPEAPIWHWPRFLRLIFHLCPKFTRKDIKEKSIVSYSHQFIRHQYGIKQSTEFLKTRIDWIHFQKSMECPLEQGNIHAEEIIYIYIYINGDREIKELPLLVAKVCLQKGLSCLNAKAAFLYCGIFVWLCKDVLHLFNYVKMCYCFTLLA